MSVVQNVKPQGVTGYYEPEMQVLKLPKCPECGDRHPLAYQPPINQSSCVSCGAALAPLGKPIHVTASLGGLYGIVATILFNFAKFLTNLAQRL